MKQRTGGRSIVAGIIFAVWGCVLMLAAIANHNVTVVHNGHHCGCSYQGARKIILHEKNIIETFFELKTGVAGEILQKFSTYRSQLAIVGDFAKYSSKNFRDFVYESIKTGRVYFVATTDEAKKGWHYPVADS